VADPLPERVDGDARPAPRAALLRGRRPSKRWRYVGVFAEDVVACATVARIAGAPQWTWTIWDRRARTLSTATGFVRAPVRAGDDALRVRGGAGTRVDLELRVAAPPVTVTSPHGGAWIWTRKTPVHARGTILAAGRAIDVDAPGLVDDSVGFHARHTRWWWSAGAGTTPGGAAVWWNLVDGMHDAPRGSERTVWVDGVAREPGPATFGPDLAEVRGADGERLAFRAEAERARRDDLLVVASDLRQPMGTFSGTLPGDVALAAGVGVVERHEARW